MNVMAPPVKAPTRLEHLKVEITDLAPGTLGQVVWFRDDYEVQVSNRLPRGMAAAVAQHLIETHIRRCSWYECSQGRIWLHEVGSEDAPPERVGA